MIDDGALDSSLEACITNVCQPGRNLLAAGYCLYSSCHTFVLTVGDGVYGFTLDPYVGEFVLTHNKIQVGPGGGFAGDCCLGFCGWVWRRACDARESGCRPRMYGALATQNCLALTFFSTPCFPTLFCSARVPCRSPRWVRSTP